MASPNNQIPPSMAFNPGQPQQRPMMMNRPPMSQMSPQQRPPPPPFVPQGSSPGMRPPTGFVPSSAFGPGQPVPSPQQQFQQTPPVPPQQQQQFSPQQLQQRPPQPQTPTAPIEEQMGNMQLGNTGVHKPGRSKRVYATLPNAQTAQQQRQPQQPYQARQQQLPANNQPYHPQQLQQQSMQQQQQQMPVQAQQASIVANTPLGLPPRSSAKPRIDPNQIPSPVQNQGRDEELYQQPGYYYGTCTKDSLPLASTNFKTLDQGNCNPRFMRATLNDVPQTNELVRETGLPFGLVIQSLALTHPEDSAIPLVPLTSEEPTRCTRCKGYLNPWCKYTQSGKKFVCNLCDFENTVPEHEYCPSDMNGRRMDTDQHPELMYGSVEFEVPKEYWNDVEPKPLHYFFAVDVSRNAVQSGMLTVFCQTIKHLLDNDGFPEGMKIGIMTYDSSVQFYNLQAGLEQATMMVVSDINDVFVPISNGLFVDPKESRSVIEGLLSQLSTLYLNTMIPNSAFSSAVQAALIAMKSVGGKLAIMQSSLPSLGPGVLRNRDDPKIYASEREKGLFAPQDNFYTQLGSNLVQAGVSVDLWLFPPPNTYADVATTGVLSALTGGDTHYFPNFNPAREGPQVAHNFIHAIQREQGYRAALRVRCSNGLSVEDQYGNFSMSNATDIELAGVNADTSIGIALKHDGGKLTENSLVFFQCALLYTTAQGQRRVRVHNLSANVGTTANPVFKQADLDTSINFLAKRTITLSAKKSLNDISNELDTFCVKILTAYRRYCASGASAAQLILPESFKVLPLLLSSFKKSAVLRKDASLNVDTRVYNLRKIKALGILGTIRWLYPRCIKLHTWFAERPTQLPLERLAYDRLDPAGIYWIESHSSIFLWIGKHASEELVKGIFGVSDFNQINPQMNFLPVIEESPINCQLRELYQKTTANTPYLPQLNVIRHGMDLEVGLSKVLVEDEILNQMSYVDYLCMIHKQIQTELEREKQDTAISSASYWAYRY